MPGKEPALTHFVLSLTPRGKHYNPPHSREEESETQRLSNLWKVTQEPGGGFNTGTQEVQACTLVNYGSHPRQKPCVLAFPPLPPFSIFTLAFMHLTIFIEHQLCPRHWASVMDAEMSKRYLVPSLRELTI